MLSVDIKGRSNVIQSDIVFELHPFDVRCLFSCEIVGLFYFLWGRFFSFWFPHEKIGEWKTTAASNSIGNLRCEQWRCAWQLFHAISTVTRSKAAKYESHLWRLLMVRGANKLSINGAAWCINMQYRLRCNLCSFSWEFENLYNAQSFERLRKKIHFSPTRVPDNLPVLELANIALIES